MTCSLNGYSVVCSTIRELPRLSSSELDLELFTTDSVPFHFEIREKSTTLKVKDEEINYLLIFILFQYNSLT